DGGREPQRPPPAGDGPGAGHLLPDRRRPDGPPGAQRPPLDLPVQGRGLVLEHRRGLAERRQHRLGLRRPPPRAGRHQGPPGLLRGPPRRLLRHRRLGGLSAPACGKAEPSPRTLPHPGGRGRTKRPAPAAIRPDRLKCHRRRPVTEAMENVAALWARARSNPLLSAGAAAAGAQCARHARELAGRLRRGWLLMGGSCLAWALGMVAWTTYESVLGRDVPFPSLADVGFLAAVPLAVAAVLIFPTAPQRLAAQARTVVDGLVIGSSLLVVSWVLALGPVVRGG